MATMNHFPDKNEYEVKLKKKGIFYKYDDEFPTSILGSYISKDEYKKIIKQINKIVGYSGKVFVYGCTIILFPVSIYYVIKSANESSKFFYDINLQLREKNIHVALLMKPFNERKYGDPKTKVVFFYPKSTSIEMCPPIPQAALNNIPNQQPYSQQPNFPQDVIIISPFMNNPPQPIKKNQVPLITTPFILDPSQSVITGAIHEDQQPLPPNEDCYTPTYPPKNIEACSM